MAATEQRIREVDGRLLSLRADYLACCTLVRACDEAIERLEAYHQVVGGTTRVPALALERLQEVREDWSSATEDVFRQIEGQLRPVPWFSDG